MHAIENTKLDSGIKGTFRLPDKNDFHQFI